MDRWGASEECEICGRPQSFGHFVVCPICERTMCYLCIYDHDCHDVCADREDGQVLGDVDNEQSR